MKPIGIFDSGMGGLTVMRALKARLPRESFVYLGDTARLPYGTKSADTVTRYAVQASAALMKYDIKLLVVACNTASAAALPALSQTLAPVPVIGVIEPGAEAAVAAAPE
ncbi:MAG TPA: aspartate/glutamate racemase family protein, partial [Rhizomicrobium sp.]|nr:aspartate/glutamate racemase family protein [Rhizomicrobium sp.]